MGDKGKRIKKLEHLIESLILQVNNLSNNKKNESSKSSFIRPKTYYGFLGGKTWVCNLEPCPEDCSICGFKNYRPQDQ